MEYHRARLQYQFNKLRPIREGIYPAFGGNTEFELFAFFEICHHLKDWIKNSPECKSFSPVEKFINDSPALKICADICNTLKHKTLINPPRSKSIPGVFKISSTMTITPDPNLAMVSIDSATIETIRGEECCFALAEECMSEWKRYFSNNGV